MKIVRTVPEMHAYADQMRAAGRRIALVPTMGYLHAGHQSLMRIAAQHADVVVVSIFVNPKQFGPGEDLESYPRDWDRDLAAMTAVDVDCVFCPEVSEIYPEGYQTTVSVAGLTANLCGRSRPGHFDGVTTVVAKLLNCVKPDCAVFGQKDFQQLAVVRRMVIDLNMDVVIIGAPIVREDDGLAMSSRNTYLDADARRAALCLSRALEAVRQRCAAGERDARTLIALARQVIEAEPLAAIEYVEVCDAATLVPVERLVGETVMALAATIGPARLIDNTLLST